jgi:hypothetical protein
VTDGTSGKTAIVDYRSFRGKNKFPFSICLPVSPLVAKKLSSPFPVTSCLPSEILKAKLFFLYYRVFRTFKIRGNYIKSDNKILIKK